MRSRLKLFSIKTIISILRGAGFLARSARKFLYTIARPIGSIFSVVIFRLIILPLYKGYIKIRREIINGGAGMRFLLQNRSVQHIFISIIIIGSLGYSFALNTFAAQDLSPDAPLPAFFGGEGGTGFLVEDQTAGNDSGGFGYIPLGFSDLNADDEEVFSLIAGGGAFVRPLTATPSTGVPTRVGIETYVVEQGETIGSIANKFGISINTIIWANNLSVRSALRAGQQLTIPPTTGVLYTIKRGDTIDSIAQKYKADKERMLSFNNLPGGVLGAGQIIMIPDGRIPPPPPPPRPIYHLEEYVPVRFPGKMLWPLASRRITQYFWSRHPGIDIGTPVGSPVYAADDGIVEFIKYGRTGYGFQIILDHGNGIRTRYAHNSQILVQPGDRVSKGQIISYSGNTGRSSGPHLHFEIIFGSVRVNPLQYIR